MGARVLCRSIAGGDPALAASFGANFDEPWDLICADWMTVIRRGPRFDATLEITELATSLRESLATLDKKIGGAGR